MSSVDGYFALFDSDDGGAILLSDYRRSIHGDVWSDNHNAPEQTFEAIEAALANYEWVALAADYALGNCFEPSVAVAGDDHPARPALRGWVFGRQQRLDEAALAAFLESHLEGLSGHQRIAGVAELRASLDAVEYAAKVDQ